MASPSHFSGDLLPSAAKVLASRSMICALLAAALMPVGRAPLAGRFQTVARAEDAAVLIALTRDAPVTCAVDNSGTLGHLHKLLSGEVGRPRACAALQANADLGGHGGGRAKQAPARPGGHQEEVPSR